MATYKKGFKKQNTEMVLLKTIVVVIVSVILLVAIAFLYNTVTRWQDYKSYDQVENYADVFQMKDDAEVELGDYVIYVYSDTCLSCKENKNDILRLGNKLDENVFFLLNSSTLATSDSENNKLPAYTSFLETIGRDPIPTPMLVVVVNGNFEEIHVGPTAVINTLTSIEEGTYEPFNE
jgi:competence protein ComGC